MRNAVIKKQKNRGVTGEESFSTVYVRKIWHGSAQSLFINGCTDRSGSFYLCPQTDRRDCGAGITFLVLFPYVFQKYGKTCSRKSEIPEFQKQAQMKARHEQKKIYRFYSCPNCAQKVRVPKGKGKICITCPKCKTEFVKRS